MKNTLAILFFIRTEKLHKSGKAPIYLRVTVNGDRSIFSTKRSVFPNLWSKQRQQVKGTKEEARTINKYLANLRSKVHKIHDGFVTRDEFFNAKSITGKITGQQRKGKTLVEMFLFYNKQVKERVGIDMSIGTYKKYETVLRISKEFMKKVYNTDDMYLHQLNHEFVTLLDHHLRTFRKCNNNSAIKYLRLFKRITNLALRNEWLDKDPFRNFTMKLNEVKRGFLTNDELNAIIDLDIDNERLDLVRDIFIFSCYTGLAYVDVRNMTPKNIVFNMDGDKCISMARTKTKAETYVPLFDKPLELLEKYADHPRAVHSGKLMPILSNQKMNAYLKEIADLARVEKNITFHLARHTFATTVLLNNNVPYESVKVMLGHKDIKTTQHYAKVMNSKVNDDVRALKNLLSNNDKSKHREDVLKVAN